MQTSELIFERLGFMLIKAVELSKTFVHPFVVFVFTTIVEFVFVVVFDVVVLVVVFVVVVFDVVVLVVVFVVVVFEARYRTEKRTSDLLLRNKGIDVGTIII